MKKIIIFLGLFFLLTLNAFATTNPFTNLNLGQLQGQEYMATYENSFLTYQKINNDEGNLVIHLFDTPEIWHCMYIKDEEKLQCGKKEFRNIVIGKAIFFYY